jgi:hypothetical protein
LSRFFDYYFWGRFAIYDSLFAWRVRGGIRLDEKFVLGLGDYAVAEDLTEWNKGGICLLL